MMDKARRILALLMMLLMLSSVVGPENIVLLTAYASDGIAEEPREEDVVDVVELNDEEEFVSDSETDGTDDPADDSTNDSTDDQTDDPANDPVNDPTDDPADDSTNGSTDDQTDDPANDPTDDPTDDSTNDSTDDPTDDPIDDPDEPNPSDEELVEDTDNLYEDSGDYVSVCITGTCPSNLQPEAGTITIQDNEQYCVLEAWSVGNLSEDCSLSLTAKIIALPEPEEGERFSFVALNEETIGSILREELAVGDTQELALAMGSVTGVALVKLTAESEADEKLYTAEDPLWANDDLYLTGRMPKNAVATAEPVTVTIDGEEVLAAWDIKIYSDADKVGTDEVWQPEDDKVQVHLRSEAFDGLDGTLNVYHMEDAESEAELVGTAESEADWVSFDAESFSLYVVSIVIDKTITATDGNTYKITVTYDDESGIPEGARLQVRELTGEEYEEYLGRTAVLLEAASFGFARIFDITIVDAGAAECQPIKPVSVKVQMLDVNEEEGAAEGYSVVHFGEEVEKIGAQTDGNMVSFAAESFSAYAIVDAPEPISAEWEQIHDLESFDAALGQELCIGHPLGYYFTGTTYIVKGSRTGILKTKPASPTPPASAVLYYGEKTADGKYKFYWTDDSTRHYVKGTNDSLSFTDEVTATAFTLIPNDDGTWQVKPVNNGWCNQQGTENGKGFAVWTENNADSRIVFWHQRANVTEDPYGFDGKNYGLMNWGGGTAGKAMMANAASDGMLEALALTVMTHKDNDADKLFVPKDSDITMWTFHWLGADHYSLSADVDGSTKYLSITSEGLSLSNTPCEIQVVPGTGVHAGEVFLRVGGATLTYSGNVEQGFGVGGTVGSEWLHLVDLSELTSDYFMIYSADKVSVSETPNDARIIVYTRVWNSAAEKYEFYAIDHDGTLVPCFESGDSIQWVGSMINTMLWKFNEYYWEGTTDPNYYYDLYNEYEDKFIAPRLSASQILQDDAIGINLDGRQSGYYSSTIVTWDDGSYAYAGLKADMTTGKIVPCLINEAEDFFFAIVHDLPVDDELTTVQTVEHKQYGISMKIKDFDTRAEMSNFLGNDDGGTGTVLHQRLLSSKLVNGYPTAAGGSLGTLMSGAREVDHLFIESTYQSSGYYEYDSTQNFASLQDDNNFVVYKEIGSYDSSGSRPSLKHGQFYPFNDIEPGVFASTNGKNLYDANGNPLPDDDPRKNERLYLIKNPDYFFAVEIEASFTQTPSGLDAWNHDIKYEFTGDDDFWLYVDDILVIDLGGIHSAVPGSVNYRTGSVNVNGVPTTLYDIFSQHLSAEELAETFEPNDQGQMVFKDNSTHTMKIFYMERGAGASNLHMRFNLASIKPGTVELSKKLSGVDTTEAVLASFPYQIWYKTADNTEHLYTDANRVCFKDSIRSVPYKESLTIGGIEYASVFMLKPGEIAVINLPEDAVEYKIVECGVSTQVFSQVKVNDTEITGTEAGNQRSDFAIPYTSSSNRARVVYDNVVNPDTLRTLSFTKKLFKEDGITELPSEEDSTPFAFRLYLGAEFDENPEAANKHSYHVKNPSGYYCMWNQTQGELVATGWNDFDLIPESQRASVTFHTSLYGQISMIPASYTVEMRNVLAGTQFQVVERPTEMPDGYSFQKYVYTDAQGQHEYTDAWDGVEDQIRPNEDPKIDICNLRGWGLRVNKGWTDTDYMEQRADTYFAVFTDDGSGNLTLVDGTVRRMRQNESTLYWYFLPLPVQNVPFENYLIREISISAQNPTVDADGNVTNYGTITIIEDGGTIAISGRQKGETASSDFNYTVQYQKGDISDGSNVRVDTVTNNRPGVVLRKVDWSGNPLEGTSFTLTDSDGSLIGSFTSDELGQITVAFLRENVDYTLTETKTPQGITGVAPMTVRFSGSTVSVSGVDEKYYTITQAEGEMPVLTVKNRPYSFQAIKQSAKGDSLGGAHFALHRQVTVDGVTIIEPDPMTGYEDLVTDAQGIVPLLDNTLPPGTYELREKSPPSGYSPLTAYIRFTVSPIGEITLGTHPEGVELSKAEPSEGPISFTLIIPNDMGLPAPTNYNGAAHTDGFKLLLAAGILLALISLLPVLFRRRKGAKSS